MAQHSDSPPTRYTFTQIIDADHLTIQTLAAKTRRLLSSSPISSNPATTTATSDSIPANISTTIQSLIPILHEITWRLIRHDLSESLVMRPAFIATLPSPQGQEMAEHDQRDHANGRILLLSILDRLESLCRLAATAAAAAAASGVTSSSSSSSSFESHQLEQLNGISEQVIAAFDDLGKHMAIESGEFLPYFETLIDAEVSWRLAREYTTSLCVTPYLKVPCPGESERSGQMVLVFDDVAAYVRMDPAELKNVYENLVARAKSDGALREAMRLETERELERLQIWKWRSLTAKSDDTGPKQKGQESDKQASSHRSNKL